MSEGRAWINPKYTILEIDAAELNRFPEGTEVIQVEGAELSKIPVYAPLKDETARQIQSWYENRRD